MNGIELIVKERERQINEEGWTLELDEQNHDDGGLALVASCYLVDVVKRISDSYLVYPQLNNMIKKFSRIAFPWDGKYWKPTPQDNVRQLVKAGALIAAEIDRLQRRPAPNDRKEEGK